MRAWVGAALCAIAVATIDAADAQQVPWQYGDGTATLSGSAVVKGTLSTGGPLTAPGIVSTGAISGDASGVNVTAAGGTVARTPATRAADVVNVLDKGADPTGVADSSTAINAAVATACAATPHKAVYIPFGTYMIGAANVWVKCSPLTIQGDGATLIASASNTINPALLRVSAQNSGAVLITGLVFDGNFPTLCPVSEHTAVTVLSSSHTLFDKDVFQNTCGVALNLSTSIKYSGVTNSRFTNTGMYWHTTGLLTDAHQSILVTDVVLSGWTATGSSTGNFVRNNSFDTLGFDAVSVFYNSMMDVSGNTFDPGIGNQWYDGVNGNACVYLVADKGTTVSNNRCVNASGNAFDLGGNGYTTVSGNYVAKAGLNCISVGPGRNFVNTLSDGDLNTSIIGNTVTDCGQVGAGHVAGGITLLMPNSGTGPHTITGASILNNSAYDDQATQTQDYGVLFFQSPVLTDAVVRNNQLAHNALAPVSPAAQPAISNCGTGPTLDTAATDLDGTITIGTGTVTSCTLTFVSTFTAPPRITLTTNSTSAIAAVTAVSTTGATFGFSGSLGGGTVIYHAQ